ncbi:MAG TPA: ubiquinol oxidase subunit II [Coxiellaceae bacterium]|nr:ubiquinol oxidase subunit II [Coxiellaceae bacterium]
MNVKRCTKVFYTLLGLCFFSASYANNLGFLDPKGWVAKQELQLMLDTVALMLIVVIPVIIMSFAFAWRYRASKRQGQYQPNWSHSTLLELFWWGIPTILVIVLGVFVWKSSHELDPYRQLDKPGKPEIIQVVALQWKWLFIYPKEGIATINDLYVPVNQQVEFRITADAPMSAFGIPQLVGQIYAMAGMRTRLHMYSSNIGVYDGLNTQLNGDGFAYMHFPVHVASADDFSAWVNHVKAIGTPLTTENYGALYEPTINAPAQYFSSVSDGLFHAIMMQYMENKHWLHSLPTDKTA